MGEESGSDLRERRLQALYALAQGTEGRSETAQLRDIIDGVEAALRAGASRQAILDTLHEHGFRMSMNSFESALYRIRKERRDQTSQVATKVDDGRNEAAVQSDSKPEQSQSAEARKRRREAVADRYIKDDNPFNNPLLKKLQEEAK